jgi:hypothetical protein
MPRDRDVERELEEREREERRQRSGTTPPERVIERTPDVEPGVEWHAGEDAGEVPAPEEDDDTPAAVRDERDALDAGVVPS